MPDFRGVKEFFKDTLAYIIVIIGTIFIFVYVFSFHQTVGNSMAPNLKDGDVAALSKISYKLFSIKRNDVVAIETADSSFYVKRIIGLPGEEIHYLDNILYINGEAYSEEFLSDDVETNNFMFSDICSIEKCPDGVIPSDMYLVLGDNREDSLDSRDSSLGLVSKEDIVGKSLFIIWPLNRISKT
ncbi:MAG TPA: signal peptidase I [Bacilli bacterium]|nr:signal peptidase I [Bacilli bacterium]